MIGMHGMLKQLKVASNCPDQVGFWFAVAMSSCNSLQLVLLFCHFCFGTAMPADLNTLDLHTRSV